MPMKVGDYFEVRGGRISIPEGKHVCLWALQSLMPLLPAKQRDLGDPGDWLPAVRYVSCPDPHGMVIYRIDRIPPSGAPAHASTRLRVDASSCSGCRSCELACSFWRSGAFDPSVSRIRVQKDERQGSDIPRVCRQCNKPSCAGACAEGALRQDPVTRAITVSPERCTGCGKCADACPFGAVFFHPVTRKPLICDLCGGEPQCIERCATGALSASTRTLRGGDLS